MSTDYKRLCTGRLDLPALKVPPNVCDKLRKKGENYDQV